MNEGTIFFAVTVPAAWPPPRAATLYQAELNGATIVVSYHASGTLGFDVHMQSDCQRYETPQLILPQYAFLKMAFSWGGGVGPFLAINGLAITDPSRNLRDSVTVIADSHVPTGLCTPLTFDIPPSIRGSEQNFLRSLIELQGRISSHDHFDLLQASGILRRLLIDSHPLIHLVNRTYREKLHFPFVKEIPIIRIDEGPTFESTNPCPAFALTNDVELLTLDDFLGRTVLKGLNHEYSVKDVISVCANVKGAIHVDERPAAFEASLLALDASYLPYFAEASLAALPGIAWSLVNAARPLVERILGSR